MISFPRSTQKSGSGKAAFYCLGNFELKKKVGLVGVNLRALVKQ
jgi:hypothetical protein